MYQFAFFALFALICKTYGDAKVCLNESERSCLDEKMKNLNMKELENDFDSCCTENIGAKMLICLKGKRNDTFSDCINVTEKWDCFMEKMMKEDDIKEMMKDLTEVKECEGFKMKIKEIAKETCEDMKDDPDIEFLCNHMPKE